MASEHVELTIVLIFTIGFTLAGIFGYFAHRLKFSPLLGYLLAGYLIGPYSPGFVANIKISEQLAEIGVILMMFGVGLHFRIEDLLNVRKIAIPGAIGQTAVSTLLGTFLMYVTGWPIEAGVIIGLSVGVASTVILVRMLSENHLLHTVKGHIAIGWLLVEDLITVVVLLFIPLMENFTHGQAPTYLELFFSFLKMTSKFVLLITFMFTIGQKIISYFIASVVSIHSHELFTVTILAITFVVATGSSIAGMIMGQTQVKNKISANALPLKNAFLVLFFLSMGMLFDIKTIYYHSALFLGLLAIILIVKPVTAYMIARLLNHSKETALVLAIALGQIGEFSFILVEEASKLHLIPEAGYDIVVACAIISIAINPFLFKFLFNKKRYVRKKKEVSFIN